MQTEGEAKLLHNIRLATSNSRQSHKTSLPAFVFNNHKEQRESSSRNKPKTHESNKDMKSGGKCGSESNEKATMTMRET